MTTSVQPASTPGMQQGIPSRRTRRAAALRGPAVLWTAEALTAVAAALLMTGLATSIELNPMSRIGQVSGLAALQLRLLLLLAVVVLVLVPAMRRWAEVPVRFAAAAVAGLSSGVLAAGVSLALRDTNWPLYAQSGDSGNLQAWVSALMDGKPLDGAYPPLFPHIVAFVAEHLTHGQIGYALKLVDLLFVAMLGPLAYLSWRLLLPPLWALGIGVTAALPMAQPYKPYTTFVLVAFLPVLAKLMQLLQRAPELPRRTVAVRGAVLGLGIALLFNLYSGWFVWSAAGAVVLTVVLLLRARRTGGTPGLLNALTAIGAAAGVFLAVSSLYLVRLLGSAGSTVDRYCYFDTYTEPTYFAMWRDDLPGTDGQSTWPIPGELGGVGLFTILLLVGLGVALALGIGRAVVLTAAACTASALLMRYWYASHMERDQAVMLYPRTSAQLLYCLLVLVGLACYLIARRRRSAASAPETAEETGRRLPLRLNQRGVAIGALCALGLLFGMAGSATASKYMPDPHEGAGMLAWISQTTADTKGHCSRYAPKCVDAPGLINPADPKVDLGKLICPKVNPYPRKDELLPGFSADLPE
ncbi:hypothetical protein DR950_22110 [Kitasatospora xanthocidica]|uniref:Galactan 5-O-arabinofuranosyltransferase n=1 Tax=Kitasatospora xanthocidica TaxID=83382 RepID=A0A372ZY16_9ACTN|nr:MULTISPECIES: hypothetical protein [Streptomycetaceae]OKI04242.1 hypothetical protein AMK13_23310 [Streptomyces sp. CB02056]RGD60125.1 hypothetical protein DR950_22110 [Kitasatospora xanthocidica]